MNNYLKKAVSTKDNHSETAVFADSFEYLKDVAPEDMDILKLCAKSHYTFTPGLHLSFSGLPHTLLVYIQDGNINLTHKKQLLSLEKGYVAFIRPNTAFKLHTSSNKSVAYIFMINGRLVNFYLNKLNISEIYIHKLNICSNISENIEKIYTHKEIDDELAMMYHSNKLNDIFYELCRLDAVEKGNETCTSNDTPAFIQEIKILFDTKYYEEYSLDELENIYGKNKYRISREFCAAYDIPPFTYLNKIRISEAKKLLLNSDLNIRETGFEVGIKNTNHFINLFKKETGTTPLSFRKGAPTFLKNE